MASGGDTFGYEPDGTLRERRSADGATVSYDFDDLGALRSVGQADGGRIDYVIDAGGRRVGRMVDGVLTEGYVYGIDDSIVAQTDGAGRSWRDLHTTSSVGWRWSSAATRNCS